MPRTFQPPDVEFLHNTGTFHAAVSGDLLTLGWDGGQFVHFGGGFDPITVVRSDGNAIAGFLARGSHEASTDYTNQQVTHALSPHVMRVCHDNGICIFRHFETMDAAFRDVGVGAALVYTTDAPLYVSENGLLTCDTEAELIAHSGIAVPVLVGHVIAPVLSDGRLPVQYQY